MNRLLLSVLLAATLIPVSASSYTVIRKQNGNATVWKSNTVSWTISSNTMSDMTSDEIKSAAQGAFTAWQSVACSTIKFSFSGFKNSDPNNGIHIRFKENNWDPSVGDALAYSVSDSNFSGKISSNDIVVNAKDASWSATGAWGTNDLQGVLTHELGHSIGLDHSRDFDATMFFSGGSTHLRTLEPDDEKGACFLYPVGTFTSGAACDACDKTENCASGYCWSVGGGHTYCGQTCTSNLQCAEGYSCMTLDTQVEKQCWPDNGYCNQFGGTVPLGEFCYGNEVCETGMCITTSETAFCTQSCNGACPAGFTCSGGYCMPAGSKPNGSECEEDNECQSALCIGFLFGTSLCTSLCGKNGGSCPAGQQCLDEAVCVPPGDGSNGAPCGHPTQCAGTYCVGNKCTQKCNGNSPCPTGTTCIGGFCEGSAPGGICQSAQQCPAGMICQATGPDGNGTCQWDCNPLSGLGCPDGQVCKWRWESWTEAITGRCVAANGGKQAGQNCADAPCESDLMCDSEFGPAPVCRKDCKNDTSNNLGCSNMETCESLDDVNDPLKGLCVGKNENPPPPEPDAGIPNPTDTGSAPPQPGPDTEPTGIDQASGSTDVATGPPSVPGSNTYPEPEGGCMTSARPDAPYALVCFLLLLLAIRRRVTTQTNER